MKLGIYRIPTKDCAELFKQLARGTTRSAPSKRRALNKKKKKKSILYSYEFDDKIINF